MKQVPRIVKSTLSAEPLWYVVTRYKLREGVDAETGEKRPYLEAQTKYDVTEQMKEIIKKELAAARAASAET
jgi:hypothetical protein